MMRACNLKMENEESLNKVIEELKKIKNDYFTTEERTKFTIRGGDNTKTLMHEFVRIVVENDLVD